MISYIKGTIIYKDNNFVILKNNDIGYKIFASEGFIISSKIDEVKELFIHEHTKDDGRELYGFQSTEELKFFWKLINVSGVGPKMAHRIISSNKLEKIQKAVNDGDLFLISSISGVGKKTAQKIILELKGRLTEEEPIAASDSELVEALIQLGYSKNEAEETAKKIDGEKKTIEEKIKEALKFLGKKTH
ncbi:Holliday junction DNA helicase RuvA [Candidatus Falkowbacteria bacterium RIFOXYB2_FULL_38_15]|uniref:Holliday junction branch migration complex subunit RuvA n=1 Tax=Candidatus Falkowbacteria bacterium RIFOXYA2_FULL_38_12 TaxID=1797993 RepID=A0A1F5S5D1_9BACT|nr:MAG: Holliday junction DNA helicase RuvA [Candidatus Falkowbacteria bacterium RIFOXYA2_FULL_38_12]OGF32763.1 MAG: Holliday junction DNA helicase RuvA [Candidatus Falkowbacteria bacterium RIFOXYB2_FULL_38_15]OGF42201.1 MAG: Holliday junction DNA helicase RuvA [Candidatus Falkowbacteria bacterium RIFOXYD2_FULL_39_16]